MEEAIKQTQETFDPSYGIPNVLFSGQKTKDDGTTYNSIDVLDVSLSKNIPLDDVIFSLNKEDEIITNDIEYYKRKYGAKYNPEKEDALDEGQIQNLYNKNKLYINIYEQFRANGLDMAAEYKRDKMLQSIGRTFDDDPIIPFSKPFKTRKEYKGISSASNNLPSTIATDEQIAEDDDKILVENDGKLEYNNMPYKREDFKKLYPNSVVTVTYDLSRNNKPTLTVVPKDTFIPSDRIYSTTYGAKELYGSKLKDFLSSFVSGAGVETIKSFQSLRAFANDLFRYDDDWIFNQGQEALDDYIKAVKSAVESEGNIKALKLLESAIQSKNKEALKQAFLYARTVVSPKTAMELKYMSQPLDYEKVDREIQASINKLTSSQYNISESTANGVGFWNFAARQGLTMGMLLPQIMISYMTGGAAMGAQAALGAGKFGLGIAKAMHGFGLVTASVVGTSQAFSDFYRTGVELQVDPELLSRMSLFALPLTMTTEVITNKLWLFRNIDNPVRESLIKNVYGKTLKNFVGRKSVEVSDNVLQKEAGNMVQNMFKDKGFQTFINGIKKSPINRIYTVPVGAELVQENLENIGYNTVQLIIDNNRPDYFEETSKYGTKTIFDGFADTSLGTILATTAMQFFTGHIPHMIRKAKGIPDTPTDEEQKKYILHTVMSGKSDELVNDAYEAWKKKEFDESGINMSDIIQSEDELNEYVVPESPIFSRFGFKAGEKIKTLNDMRFIEFLSKIDLYQKLVKDLELSEGDISILRAIGVEGDVLLTKSIDALEELYSIRQEINNLEKPDETEESQNSYNIKLKELQDKYNKAKIKYDNYVKPEEETDLITGETYKTEHSKVVNDVVKQTKSIIEMVNNKVKEEANVENIKEIKNKKKYSQYFISAWQDVLAKEFSYDNFQRFITSIKENQRDHIEKLIEESNRIKQKPEDPTSGLENQYGYEIDQKIKELNDKYEKTKNDLETIYVKQREYEELTKSYESEKDENKKTEIKTKIDALQYNEEDIYNISNDLNNELKNLTNTFNNYISNSWLDTDDIFILREKYENTFNNISSQVEESIEGLSDNFQLKKLTFDYSPKLTIRDNDILEFNSKKRIEKIEEEIKRNYISNYFKDLLDYYKELHVYITSYLNKTGEYEKEYKNEGRFNNLDNFEAVINNAKNIVENKFYLKMFDLADAMSKIEDIDEYMLPSEKEFINEFSRKELNENNELVNVNKQLFKETISLAQKILDKSGELSNSSIYEIRYSNLILHETIADSIREILLSNLVDKKGNPLFSSEEFREFNDMKKLTAEDNLIKKRGEYTDEEIKECARREQIIINALNILWSKKNEVFSDENLLKLTEIFRFFAGKSGHNTPISIFSIDDSMSHIDANIVEKIKDANGNEIERKRNENPTVLTRESLLFQNWRNRINESGDVIYAPTDSMHHTITRLSQHLNILLWINSEMSPMELLAIRKENALEDDNNPLETVEQETVTNTLVSVLLDKAMPENGLLSKIYKITQDVYVKNVNIKNKNERIFIPNITIVSGDYGTGKTVISLLKSFEYISEKQNIEDEVIFVSLSTELMETHKNTYNVPFINNKSFILYNDFLKKLDEGKLKKENVIYIVDEASIISTEYAKKLREYFYNTNVKLIYLADIHQMRDNDSIGRVPNILANGFRTIHLSKQFSTNSPLLREIAILFKTGISNMMPETFEMIDVSEITDPKNDKRKYGARYYYDKLEMWKAFLEDKNEDKAIIFYDNVEYEEFKKKYNIQEDNQLYEKYVYYAKVPQNKDTKKLLQGLRRDNVYMMFDSQNEEFSFALTGLYTGAGRARYWIGLYDSTGKYKNVSPNLTADTGYGTNKVNINDVIKNHKEKERLRYTILQSSVDKEKKETQEKKTTKTNIKNKSEKYVIYKDGIANEINIEIIIGENGDSKTSRITIKITGNTLINEVTEDFTIASNTVDIDKIFSNVIERINNGNIKLEFEEEEEENEDEKNEEKEENTFIAKIDGIETEIEKGEYVLYHGKQYEVITITNKRVILRDEENNEIELSLLNNTLEFGNLEELYNKKVEESYKEVQSQRKYLTTSILKFNSTKDYSVHYISSATLVGIHTYIKEKVELKRMLQDALLSNINNNGFSFELYIPNRKTGLNDKNEKLLFPNIVGIRVKIINDQKALAFLNKMLEIMPKEIKLKWNTYNNGKIDITNVRDAFKALMDFDIQDKEDILSIGSLTEINFPKITGKHELFDNLNEKNLLLYNVFEDGIEDIESARNQLESQYNEIVDFINKTIKEDNKELLDYLELLHKHNLSLLEIYERLNSEETINIKMVKDIKTLYEFNPKTQQTVESLLSNATDKVTNNNLKFINGRIFLEINLLNNNQTLYIPVRLPKISDKETGEVYYEKVKKLLLLDKERFDNVLINIKYEDAQKEEIGNVFYHSNLRRLLLANNSRIKQSLESTKKTDRLISDEVYDALYNNIKIEKGKFKLAGHTVKQLVDSYNNIIESLINIDKINFDLYDFFEFDENNRFKLHDGITDNNELYKHLVTHVTRINNTHGYAYIENNKFDDDINVIKHDLIFESYEEVSESNTDEEAINEINNLLGEDFSNSKQFLINDGLMTFGEKIVSGVFKDNSNIIVSRINGSVRVSTVRHEAFHMIFRNFIKPEERKKLIKAAALIAKNEDPNFVPGNEEEWMARDFGKNTNRTEEYASIWERFKAWLKALIHGSIRIYYAQRRLGKMYSRMNSGEFKNRYRELIINPNDKVFEEESMESNLEDELLSEEEIDYEAILNEMELEEDDTKITLVSAVNTINKNKKKNNNKLSTQKFENIIKFMLWQNSFFNNIENIYESPSIITQINNTIEQIIKYTSEYGDYKVKFIGDNTIYTIKEVIEANNSNWFKHIDKEWARRNNLQIKFLQIISDMYRMSKPEIIKSHIQFIMKSWDIEKGEIKGKAGHDLNYRWDKSSLEASLTDFHLLGMSVIYRVNMDGYYDIVTAAEKGNFFDPKYIKQVLVEISNITDRNISIIEEENKRRRERGEEEIKVSRYYVYLATMEKLILSKIYSDSARADNVYNDDFVQAVHGIYNTYFGTIRKNEFAKPRYLSFDYNNKGNYVSLAEKAVQLDRIIQLETDKTSESYRLKNEKKEMINNYIISLLSLMSSQGTYDMVSHMLFYNDDSELTMKTEAYQKEQGLYVGHIISDSLQNITYRYKLTDDVARLLEKNIDISKDTKEISINDQPFLRLEYDNKTGTNKYRFVSQKDTHYTHIYQINEEEIEELAKIYQSINKIIGLSIISENVFKTILRANNWSELTHNLIQEGFGLKYHLTDIIANYNMPFEFLSDYLGNLIGLYEIYNLSFIEKKYLYDERPIINKISFEDLIDRLSKITKDEEEEFSSLTGYKFNGEKVSGLENATFEIFRKHIVHLGDFMKNIMKKNPFEDNVFWVKSDISDISEESEIEIGENKFVTANDFYPANNLLGFIVARINGNISSRQLSTGSGGKINNINNKSEFQQRLLTRGKLHNINEVKLDIGIKKNIGFLYIGKNKIAESDFTYISINMFMQELLKGKKYADIIVPAYPVSDSGRILYLTLGINIFKEIYKNRLEIRYDVVAKELLRAYDIYNEQVNLSRNKLLNLINNINSVSKQLGISEIPYMPAYTRIYKNIKEERKEYIKQERDIEKAEDLYYKIVNKALRDISIQANKNGTIDILKSIIDNSDLTKDISGNGNFDISYNIENNQLVFGLGKTILRKVESLEYLKKKNSKGIKYIENIRYLLQNYYDKSNLNEETDGYEDKYETATKEYLIRDSVEMLLRDEFKSFASTLKEMNVDFVGSYYDLAYTSNNARWGSSLNSELKGNLYYIDTKKGRYQYNVPLFAFMVATIIANNRIDEIGLNPLSFKSFMDKVKRNGPMNTPSQEMMTNVRYSNRRTISNDIIPEEKNISNGAYIGTFNNSNPILVVYDDIMNVQLLDGEHKINKEEGQINLGQLAYLFTKTSIGGTEFTVMGNNKMLKTISNWTREDLSTSQIKCAEYVLNDLDFQTKIGRNKSLRILKESDKHIQKALAENNINIRISLLDKFTELYNNSTNKNTDIIFKQLYDWIIGLQYDKDGNISEEGIRLYEIIVDNIVVMIAPLSTQKGAVQRVTMYDAINDNVYGDEDIELLAYDIMPANSRRFILNSSQPDDLSKMQQVPNQAELLFGVSSSPEVKDINEKIKYNRASAQYKALKNVKSRLSKYFDKINWVEISKGNISEQDIKLLEKAKKDILRELKEDYKSQIALSKRDLAYMELLSSDNVSEQIPLIRAKLIMSLRKQMSNALQAKTSGIRVVQTTGDNINLYSYKGRVYKQNEILRHLGKNINQFTLEQLVNDEVHNYILSIEGVSEYKIHDMYIDENGDTQDGSVIMPMFFKDIYGFRGDESMLEIFGINLYGDDINYIDIMNYTPSEFAKYLSNQFLNNKNHIAPHHDIIDENGNIIYLRRIALENLFNSRLVNKALENIAKRQETTVEEIKKEMMKDDVNYKQFAKYLNIIAYETHELARYLDKALQIFISRVPFTFLGCAATVKAVTFHNNGNIIYISSDMNARTDADYDIDALTSYINYIGEDGKLGNNDESKFNEINNRINELRIELYHNKNIQQDIFVSMHVSDIKEVAKRKEQEYAEKYPILAKRKKLSNNTPTSIFRAYKRNHAGASSIGIMANSLNSIGLIFSNAYNTDRKWSNKVRIGNQGLLYDIVYGMTNNILEKNTIYPKQGKDGIVLRIGSWEQVGLDNAKLNILGEYELSENVINILVVMVALGKTNEEIYDFFHNYEISKLIHEYDAKSSLRYRSRDYDLYTMAYERMAYLESLVKTAKLKRYNETFPDRTINTVTISTQELNEIKSNIIELIEDTAKELATKRKDTIYSNVTDIEEEKDNILNNIYKLYISEKNNINEEFTAEELTQEVYKEILNKLETLLDIENELENLLNYKEGLDHIKQLPEYIVTADTLYILSRILRLRTDISVLDAEFNRQILDAELAFGMRLADFISLDLAQMNTKNEFSAQEIEKKLRFYIENSEYYANAKDEKEKDILLKKQKQIIQELDIALLVKSIPQLNNIITVMHEIDTISKLTFIYDSKAVENVQKEFLIMQNRSNIIYGNELSIFNKVITQLIFDTYYEIYPVKIQSIDIPNLVYVGNNELAYKQNKSDLYKIDLSNPEQREIFINTFPQFIIAIKNNRHNLEFLKAIIPDDVSENMNIIIEKLKDLENNEFIKRLDISNKYSNLRFNTDSKILSDSEIDELRNEYNNLPDFLKEMIYNYEMIRNNLNFRRNGILEIIGTEHFKGNISKLYERIIRDLTQYDDILSLTNFDRTIEKGSEEYNTKLEEVKEKIFDKLASYKTFSKSIPYDEMHSRKPGLPKYIRTRKTFGEFGAKSKEEITYKRDKSGIYVPMYFKTRYSLSESVEIKTYIMTLKEYIDIETKGYAESTNKPKYLKTGELLYNQKGELLVVTSTTNYTFQYKKVNEKEKETLLRNYKQKYLSDINVLSLEHGIGKEVYSFYEQSVFDGIEYEIEINKYIDEFTLPIYDNKNNIYKILEHARNTKVKTLHELQIEYEIGLYLSIESKQQSIRKWLESEPSYAHKVNYLKKVRSSLIAELFKLRQRINNPARLMTEEERNNLQSKIENYELVLYSLSEHLPYLITKALSDRVSKYIVKEENKIKIKNAVTSSENLIDKNNIQIGSVRLAKIIRDANRVAFGAIANYDVTVDLINSFTNKELALKLYNENIKDKIIKLEDIEQKDTLTTLSKAVIKSYEYSNISTAFNNLVYIVPDGKGGVLRILRSSAIKQYFGKIFNDLDNVVLGRNGLEYSRGSNKYNELFQVLNVGKKFKIGTKGETSKRLQETYNIGNEFDRVARTFLPEYLNAIKNGNVEEMQVIYTGTFEYIDIKDAEEFLKKGFDKLLEQYPLSQFSIDIETKEMFMYDTSNATNLNRIYELVDENGNIALDENNRPIKIDGIGTQQDMFISIKSLSNNSSGIILVDFKTESDFWEETVDGKKLNVAKKIDRLNQYKIQMAITRNAALSTYDIEVNSTMIFRATKVKKSNGLIGFTFPNEFYDENGELKQGMEILHTSKEKLKIIGLISTNADEVIRSNREDRNNKDESEQVKKCKGK